MKKVVDYRKLLGVDKSIDLKELKTVYRNLMKEWHPDKFQESDERKADAEEKSKDFIEAYNYLVSIAPETIELNKEDYSKTISSSNVVDYHYKAQVLEVKFSDGSSYEYLDVPHKIYQKLVNSDIPGRFVRRNICSAFVYRKISGAVTE